MSERHLELHDIPQTCWALLRKGAERAQDPFHTVCLATNGTSGPSQRTVVLRYVDEQARLLACHTDRRSPKMNEIAANAASSWLFYDAARKLQLRMEGRLEVHIDDAFAEARWRATRLMGRACYNAASGPGERVATPPGAPAPPGTDEETERARKHFAVISVRVDSLDWLQLSRAGHRRAQFRWTDTGIEARWVSP